jgi:MFS family permease
MSTFLIPSAISAFFSGWLCDKFGSKIVSLTFIVISIPAFIWIGVPNQEIQSIVPALSMSGATLAGTFVSIVLVAAKVLHKLIQEKPETENSGTISCYLLSTTLIFGIISSTAGTGYFVGLFLSKLNGKIGFFWLCFIFSMLLLTCVPLMVFYSRNKTNRGNIGLSKSTSKKSIVNNTRPASFAESILSDDTTIGTASDDSECCDMVVERKSSIIVIP